MLDILRNPRGREAERRAQYSLLKRRLGAATLSLTLVAVLSGCTPATTKGTLDQLGPSNGVSASPSPETTARTDLVGKVAEEATKLANRVLELAGQAKPDDKSRAIASWSLKDSTQQQTYSLDFTSKGSRYVSLLTGRFTDDPTGKPLSATEITNALINVTNPRGLITGVSMGRYPAPVREVGQTTTVSVQPTWGVKLTDCGVYETWQAGTGISFSGSPPGTMADYDRLEQTADSIIRQGESKPLASGQRSPIDCRVLGDSVSPSPHS